MNRSEPAVHAIRSPDPEVFDVASARQDFPVLGRVLRGKPLVYLDNGATSQKPRCVIDAVARFYSEYNANVHRGLHTLSQEASEAYEQGRERARRFLNAASVDEIVFVRGTTEAVNLVAQSFARPQLEAGDEILLSELEHHSNIVPWQLVAEQTGAHVRVAPIDDNGDVILEAFRNLLGPRTRLVALAHVSNALGTINPVKEMVAAAHDAGIPVLLDGAQAVPHLEVDVQELDCDFYAFSGHKVYGPTGIGVLYGKARLLEAMPPYQGGGEMIERVSFSGSTYNRVPYRFEAGTPNIAGAIGLGVALEYVSALGLGAIAAHESELLDYATEAVAAMPGLRIIGTARRKAGILSFVMEGAHASDIGTIVDLQGVAIRAGHHCAMPALEHFGVGASARASFALYNTREEVDALLQGIHKVRELLG